MTNAFSLYKISIINALLKNDVTLICKNIQPVIFLKIFLLKYFIF